jgi:signal transduction histidine kinase
MSVDVLERAQELFYSTKSMGSGIGLALVREVAELFGGTLSIESKESEGTRVTVRLPMKKSS